ncbi:MAG TPA: site-2 protease family protein [Pirellulales bacterium]|nr:site-2 protease family protein [Pirellulales bacterium]
MRDLLGWNLSLGRWAGIQVRVHVFFLLLVVIALQLSWDDPRGELIVDAAVSLAVLFVSVLAHELGHCFAARRMGGRAEQIVLWPLGGLVSINLSHQPQEELVTAAAGPIVNLFICLATLPALALLGVDVRLLANPLVAPQTADGMSVIFALQLTAWINWLLVLVNLLPAYPLDGGRVLRSIVWQRKGYRTAVIVVARVAKATAVATWIAAWLVHSHYAYATLPLLLLGILLFFSAKQETDRLQDREVDEGVFGYDFSQGYTSLERNFTSTPRKSPGLLRQWLDGRREARRVRQQRTEEEDDRRVDEVLARLHEVGRDGLSDDDRALLDRVSARYRNRQRG